MSKINTLVLSQFYCEKVACNQESRNSYDKCFSEDPREKEKSVGARYK